MAAEQEQKDEEFMTKFLNSRDGFRFLDILRATYYDVSSYDENAGMMAYIGGQRDLIEDLLNYKED